jgi:GTPase
MLDQPGGQTLNTHTAANATVLVSLDFGGGYSAESLEELRLLAASDQLEISAIVKGKRSRPDPATFAGSGKVEEITAAVEQTGASFSITTFPQPSNVIWSNVSDAAWSIAPA